MNFLEGDDVRDGTAFNMTIKSNNINITTISSYNNLFETYDETRFKISMNMTVEKFDQSITISPKILKRFTEGKTLEETNEVKNFRLAIGYVGGLDIPGGSNQVKWSLFPHSVGPRGETANVDRFAVFYKNGTFDFGRPSCAWYNQLPQGFSCGKGSTPIKECSGRFERFEPVACDQLVLKVANDQRCNLRPEGVYLGSEDNYRKDEFDSEDCFTGVNWT